MSTKSFYTISSGVFQEFLTLVGKLVYSRLVRQIEYLKVENEVLRSKLKRRMKVTSSIHMPKDGLGLLKESAWITFLLTFIMVCY